MDENKVFYISLARGLQGYYVKVLATNEHVVREYAGKYMGRLWCSVYTSEDLDRFRKNSWKTEVVNRLDPIELGDCSDYE